MGEFYRSNKHMIIAGVTIVAGLGLVYYNRNAEQIIYTSFGNGSGLSRYNEADASAGILRPKLQSDLEALLRPPNSKNYGIIVGAKGSGKSTAIRQCIRNLENPKGVIYINCPSDPKLFGMHLRQILTDNMNNAGWLIRWLNDSTKEEGLCNPAWEPVASFNALRSDLLNAAAAFKASSKYPLVLVIDSADRLAEK